MAIKIANLRRVEKHDLKGDRSAWKIGNPFVMRNEGERELVIDKFRYYLANEIATGRLPVEYLRKLDGKTIACWCAPKNCHLEIVDKAIEYLKTNGPERLIAASRRLAAASPY